MQERQHPIRQYGRIVIFALNPIGGRPADKWNDHTTPRTDRPARFVWARGTFSAFSFTARAPRREG